MVLTVFLILTFVGCESDSPVETVKEKITTVEVSKPTLGSLVNETTIVGRLQAKTTAIAFAQVAMPEEILEVNYKIGDYVNKDDVIVILDSESADDQVENARLSYETARRNYNAVLESVNVAKANLERTQALYDQGVASKQQLEAAELQASEGQLKTLASQLSQAKFAYENAQKSIDNTTVLAPISGVISSLGFEKDNLATSQNSLIITDLASLEIDLMITEDVLLSLTDDTKVYVLVDSFDQRITSEIVSTNPVADQRTGLYSMTVAINNDDMLLKPGMFARVQIVFTNDEIFLVSIDSILNDDQGSYVYTIENEIPKKAYVKVGDDDGEIIEVLEGLSENSLVVTSGQNYIDETSQVRVIGGN
jgi:RND family efflux transporter MFP subunit